VPHSATREAGWKEFKLKDCIVQEGRKRGRQTLGPVVLPSRCKLSSLSYTFLRDVSLFQVEQVKQEGAFAAQLLNVSGTDKHQKKMPKPIGLLNFNSRVGYFVGLRASRSAAHVSLSSVNFKTR
jgi:hypothetical protein